MHIVNGNPGSSTPPPTDIPGLIYVSRANFTNAAVVNETNVFDLSDAIYKIILNIISTTIPDNAQITMKLKQGSVNIDTGYSTSRGGGYGPGVAGGINDAGSDEWSIGYRSSGFPVNALNLDLFNVVTETETGGLGAYAGGYDGSPLSQVLAVRNSNAVSANGLSIIANGGLITGSLTICRYGP